MHFKKYFNNGSPEYKLQQYKQKVDRLLDEISTMEAQIYNNKKSIKEKNEFITALREEIKTLAATLPQKTHEQLCKDQNWLDQVQRITGENPNIIVFDFENPNITRVWLGRAVTVVESSVNSRSPPSLKNFEKTGVSSILIVPEGSLWAVTFSDLPACRNW